MFIRLDIEIWVIGKGATKRGGAGKVGVAGKGGMGATVFCGHCVCLGIFLLW
jgi:hypothetical protein